MYQISPGWFRMDAWLVITLVALLVAFGIFALIWGMRAHRLQVSAGREELVGKTAEVKVALEPKGTVFIEGEQWTAISESGWVNPGEEVIISRVDGLKLYVNKKR